MGAVRERFEHRCAVIDEMDASPTDVQIVVAIGHDVVDQVSQGTGRLHSGRPTADDHEVERTLVEPRRLQIGVFEQLEDPVAQPLGVQGGVEGEGVLIGSGHVQEPSPGAYSQHEVVTRVGLAGGGLDRAGDDIDRGDFGLLHDDRRLLAEQAPEGLHDVARCQLGGGHLIEQRLELVVGVPVDQGDRHARPAEPAGARHPPRTRRRR